jgi:hypothetical protein
VREPRECQLKVVLHDIRIRLLRSRPAGLGALKQAEREGSDAGV